MSDNAKLHSGHRDRVREKYLTDGFETFHDHQILEMLLFYAVPRRDTNELAHRLLNQFGSISSVFDAPLEVLMDCGLSKNAAVYLKMLADISGIYVRDKFHNDHKVINDDNIGERILPFFLSADNEQVLLLLLDAKGKELFSGIISKGSVSASEIYTRKIIRLAVKYHACGAVIAHNHPSGIPLPSKSDISATIMLKKALSAVGMRLLDHLIVADNEFLSLASLDEYMRIFL